MPDTPITLCMIVKDEEKNLARCLDSVKDLVSETIVVDTGSTDATARIAAEYGAVVIPFDFSTPDFAAARNCGLALARSPWILVLDADETLDPAGRAAVERLAAVSGNVGYYAERLNHGGGEAVTTDFAVRLFPNRKNYRYRGRVHETVDASILGAGGRLVRSNIRIHHNFVSDPEARRRRNHWYIKILMEEIEANPSDSARLDFLAAEYHQLGMFDSATAVAEVISRVRPGDPRSHLVAGIYHLQYARDLQKARADFKRVLEIRPEDAEAIHYLQTIDQIRSTASEPAASYAAS